MAIMTIEKQNQRQETSSKILASVLHDLSPERTEQEWLEHINLTAHDPNLFFGSNGEGLQEYLAFNATYDRDRYEKNKKRRTL